jgi:hypothetical protein
MQGAYGGLIMILLYAGANAIPPGEGFFLQTDNTGLLLTDFTHLLLA